MFYRQFPMTTSKKSVYATHTTDMDDGKQSVRAQKGDDPYTIVARYMTIYTRHLQLNYVEFDTYLLITWSLITNLLEIMTSYKNIVYQVLLYVLFSVITFLTALKENQRPLSEKVAASAILRALLGEHKVFVLITS